MSEEKKLILKMLKENKISEDEALKLLDAIGSNKNTEKNKKEDNTEFSTGNFVSKIINGVEKAINIASKKIENMDFELINFSSQNFNAKTVK
ncbi:SHOCT-like domain-containing protein, partial [Helcococcus ovis]